MSRAPRAARPRARKIAPVVLAGGAALAAAIWWASPRDPERELRRHAPALSHVVRTPAPQLGERVERWRIVTAAGDTSTGLWRAALPGAAQPWTIVLLGGLRTGDRAALLLPDIEANVLAMDWPWDGRRRMGAVAIARRLPAIRRAVLRSPGVLALGLDAVAEQSDPDRIVLLGASLGVPPAVAALRLAPPPEALVLVDGGADLQRLLASGLRREGCPAILGRVLAAFAARLIHPLEPALHAGAAGDLRVLLINSEDDRMIPPGSIAALRASFPQAEVRARRDQHLDPKRAESIAALTAEVLAWLEMDREAVSPNRGTAP